MASPSPVPLNQPASVVPHCAGSAICNRTRNRHVQDIAEKSRRAWQKATGYGRRSLVETAVGLLPIAGICESLTFYYTKFGKSRRDLSQVCSNSGNRSSVFSATYGMLLAWVGCRLACKVAMNFFRDYVQLSDCYSNDSVQCFSDFVVLTY